MKKEEKTKDSTLMVIWQNSSNSLATVKSFISLLGKIFLKVPHEIYPISGEITLKCKGCLLHYPQNWDVTSLPGLLAADSIKKKRNNVKTIIICTFVTFSKSLFYCVHTEEKCVQKFLLCTYSMIENVYKNSAVDLWIECYT